MRKERDLAPSVRARRVTSGVTAALPLGGVGDPVVVELEHVVCRCH